MPRARVLAIVLTLGFATLLHGQPSPTRTWNDDSCDISVAPAATLLLPYFEVDFRSPSSTGLTTLFTIVNTSPLPQIAKITLWTDWAYPVITFSAYMTGYGVASLNLRDVFAAGTVAPGAGVHAAPGSLSAASNPNHLPGASIDCSGRPLTLTASELDEIQHVFTTGNISACGSTRVGGTHANAIGYATIDVVATCSDTMPIDPAYYATEILFDNVLVGDWELVNPNATTGNYAGGNPLVHLRAIPEGGPAGSNIATNLPSTTATPRSAGCTPAPSTAASHCRRHSGLGGFRAAPRGSTPISSSGARATPALAHHVRATTTTPSRG